MKHEKVEGTVKWCDNARGFGFILDQNGEDVFVHYRAIQGDGDKHPAEGQTVSFIQVKSEKGWQANQVQKMR